MGVSGGVSVWAEELERENLIKVSIMCARVHGKIALHTVHNLCPLRTLDDA